MSTTKNVFSTLDEKYGGTVFADLHRMVNDIGTDATRICAKSVARAFGAVPNDRLPKYVYLNGSRHQLTVGPDGVNLRQLNIDVVPVGRAVENAGCYPETINLKSFFGPINRIQITAQPEVQRHLAPILDELETTIRAAYTWSVEKLRTCVRSSRTPLETELMTTVRRALCMDNREALKPELWIVLATRDRISYSIDDEEYGEIERRVERSRIFTGLGNAELVGNLVNCNLPYEVSFSRKAVEKQGREDFKVESAEYKTDHSSIQLAQEAVYRKLMSLQPIAQHKKCTVLALYPSNLASDYELIIASLTEPFFDIVERQQSHLKHISERFASLNRDLHLGQVGELIGGFAKGFSPG